MCDHDHAAEIDIETIYHEFHDIKHLLISLNESVREIAASVKQLSEQNQVLPQEIDA